MTVMPKTCACGSPMEWRAATIRIAPNATDVGGIYFCAHCDRECRRAEAACKPCRAMKVKR